MTLRAILAFAAAAMLLAACETATIKSTGPEDTAANAILRGEAALTARNFVQAEELFARAIGLDPAYLQAYDGFGRAALGAGHFEDGIKVVDRGLARVVASPERRRMQTVKIDLIAGQGGTGAYARARSVLDEALERDRDAFTDGALHMAMARAAVKFDEPAEAARLARIAVKSGGAPMAEGQAMLGRLDDQLRAGIGNEETRAIAASASITRAQLVRLLYGEYDIAKQLNLQAQAAAPTVGDLGADPASQDIRLVLGQRLRGLEVVGGNFRPTEPATREEFAMLLEDLVVRANKDRGLSRRFIGSASPFPDLSATRASFNAMMTAMGRGLLAPDVRGNAAPTAPVTGTHAILALRALRGL
ncbi:MAG: hypothetical protein FJX46_00635 [Alphaproteobacteria bacterium]|nr:hypothetical protein [Alphaproteobacteria bacterium]